MHSELSEIENNKDILSQKTRKDLSNLKQLFVRNQIFLKGSHCSVLNIKKAYNYKQKYTEITVQMCKMWNNLN